jgi:hypothetical protein
MRPLTFVLLLALAACAADAGASPPSSADRGTGDPVLVIVEGEPGNAGISVEEAIRHQPTDDIVAVTGALFVAADGSVLLCELIAESFPPQCGGARIAVEGLDLATVALESANGVRWAESVTLLGSVE